MGRSHHFAASGVTGRRAGGQMPSWQLRCGPFLKMPPPPFTDW